MVFIPRWEKYKDKKPTGPVEVDYGHELSKDAFSLTLFNNNYSLVNNIVLTGDTDVIYNNSANFDGSSSLRLTNNPIVGDYFSAVCRFKPNSILKDHAVIDVSTGVIDQQLLFWFDTSSSKLRLAAFAGSALYGTTLIDDTSKYYDVALTTDVFAHSGILYLNSKQENQGSIGSRDFTTEFVAIGANYNSAGKESDGQYEYIYLYNKQLSADEITSLHEYPYQILKPRKIFFTLTQSGGVISGSIASATATTAANTTVTRKASGSLTSNAADVTATATLGSNLSAALSANNSGVSATTTVTRHATGTFNARVAELTSNITITRKASGSLDAISAILTGSGTTEGAVAGSGALHAGATSLTSSVTLTRTVSGAVQASNSQVVGSIALIRTASGALVPVAADIAASVTVTGTQEITASGSLVAGNASMSNSVDRPLYTSDIQAIVDAVWADKRALTLAKYLGLK